MLHEDLEQIDDLDIEEMDINWQIAMIAIRMKKFYKKTGRRVRVDGKTPVGFDKKKLECFNCHNTSHFARECTAKGTHDGKKRRDSFYPTQQTRIWKGKEKETEWLADNGRKVLSIGENILKMKRQIMHSWLSVPVLTFQANEIFSKDEKLKKYGRIGMKAVKEKEQLHKTLDLWKDSSKNLWRLINSGMSSSKEDSVGKPLYSRFIKTNDFKGVPHPLSGDYTPKPQEEIDESLYVYGKKGPQEPKPSVLDDRSSECSTCQSNDSAGSIGTSSVHSVDFESEISRVPQEVYVSKPLTTNEKENGQEELEVKKTRDHPLKNMVDRGIFDSGCSGHMTCNKDQLEDFEEFNGGSVTFGGSKGYISGKGKIRVGNLDFDSVSFVKELGNFNLFSISQICDKQHKVLFTETECLVVSSDFKMPDENQILLKVPRHHNMYSFDMKTPTPAKGFACLIAKATSDESKLWHRRLGHINFKNLNKLVKGNLVRGLPSKVFKNDHTCVACHKGKQHRASCKAKLERLITEPLHTLHMDLFGPTSVKSINHASYCLVITDDCTRFSWVFFLASKDETSSIIQSFIRQIENQLNHRVKIIRSDNGTEFKNRNMLEFCGNKGIKQEYSNARTPQQNGVAKRMNRTLIKSAISMLADSHLTKLLFLGKEKDEDVELLVVPSTVKNPEEKVESRKSYTNSKKEGRFLDEIALKHLGTVSENNTTSTPSVNTGSKSMNTGRFDPDDSPMLELEIFHKSETRYFDEASYDEEGVITDFNSLPTEIEVSPTPTLRIHNIHPKSQILGDPKSAVQTRSKVHKAKIGSTCNEEPKKISEALQDNSWVQAMQEELLQFTKTVKQSAMIGHDTVTQDSHLNAVKRILSTLMANHIWAYVGFLRKPDESAGFAEIVDFLRGSNLRGLGAYGVSLTDGVFYLRVGKAFLQQARQDGGCLGGGACAAAGVEYVIVREGGVLGCCVVWLRFIIRLLRPVKLLICLSTGRVYNFSKLIFDGMVENLKSKTKFLMYPRFLQLILEIQTENKHPYLAVTLTKKIFGNMKRGFRGAPRPLLPAMLLVATTNPNAGQEHPDVAQSQPSSSTIPVPSTSLPPEQSPPPIPTPIPASTPTPIPETDPEPMEHTFEEPSPAHQHFSPP
ncbi:putative ribonuclease H-like domain-containing protein [Tanacetum coccineum]